VAESVGLLQTPLNHDLSAPQIEPAQQGHLGEIRRGRRRSGRLGLIGTQVPPGSLISGSQPAGTAQRLPLGAQNARHRHPRVAPTDPPSADRRPPGGEDHAHHHHSRVTRTHDPPTAPPQGGETRCATPPPPSNPHPPPTPSAGGEDNARHRHTRLAPPPPPNHYRQEVKTMRTTETPE
jgi:hypothetical protein